MVGVIIYFSVFFVAMLYLVYLLSSESSVNDSSLGAQVEEAFSLTFEVWTGISLGEAFAAAYCRDMYAPHTIHEVAKPKTKSVELKVKATNDAPNGDDVLNSTVGMSVTAL